MKLVRQRWRTVVWLAAVWAAGATAQAGWEMTAPGDPARNWSTSVTMTEGYDDNVYTSTKNPQGSFATAIEPHLVVSFPQERSTFGLRYTYRASFLTSLPQTPVYQSNIGDVFFSYLFSPRLVLNVSDSVRSSLDPELVQDQNGVPVIARQRSEYIYNIVGAGLSYNLSRRWTMALNGSWDFWRYSEAVYSKAYDRDDYIATLSAQYSLNPQTFVGAAYQFQAIIYPSFTPPGGSWSDNTWPVVINPPKSIPADFRDGGINTWYFSLNHRFNPQLSAQAAAGFQWSKFGSGDFTQRQVAPYFNLSGAYNFGAASAVTAGISSSLSPTQAAQYYSSDATSFFLRLNHRFTPRLELALGGSYVLYVYQNPLLGVNLPNQTSNNYFLSLGLSYAFTPWAQFVCGYTFETVQSSLASQSYERNRIALGMRLTY